MRHTPEEIGKRMDALRLWGAVLPFNWAVCPAGTVFPYFCSVIEEKDSPVRARFMMLEGWQTLHDYVRTRADNNFGIYSSPVEFPGFELMVLASGDVKLFRHDPGYMPVPVEGAALDLAAKILWESYGVFLRIESDPRLPMNFADRKALFARVEKPVGTWSDQPLEIPDPPPYTESISLEKSLVRKAKDLPFAADYSVDVDFRLLPGVMTRETPRPRCVYELRAEDSSTHAVAFEFRISISSRFTLKGLWESMPQQLLAAFVAHGRIPGHIRVHSGRVFRFLRPLCLEFPLRLSLHDKM